MDYDKLSSHRLGEPSAAHQRKRFAGTNIACNADMRVAEVCKFCPALKLACTIADLAGSDQIQTPHVAEAL